MWTDFIVCDKKSPSLSCCNSVSYFHILSHADNHVVCLKIKMWCIKNNTACEQLIMSGTSMIAGTQNVRHNLWEYIQWLWTLHSLLIHIETHTRISRGRVSCWQMLMAPGCTVFKRKRETEIERQRDRERERRYIQNRLYFCVIRQPNLHNYIKY